MSGPSSPVTGRRLALLINPAAGRHDDRRLARLADRLGAHGFAVETVVSRAPGDLAARLPSIEADIVAVSGGDGTINEVVGALCARTRPPRMAVVASGTANVLAHEYRLPKSIEAICAAIAAGRTRPLHLGWAATDGEAARPFFLMTSVGVDAAIVHAVEARAGKRFKKLAFAVEAVKAAGRDGPTVTAEIETADGRHLTIGCAVAIVSNARHYGGPFVLTRETGCDRPGLRLVALRQGGGAAMFRAAMRLASGKLEISANVVALDVRRIRLTSADTRPAHAQIDGEPHGHAPIEVSASDRVLELIVP